MCANANLFLTLRKKQKSYNKTGVVEEIIYPDMHFNDSIQEKLYFETITDIFGPIYFICFTARDSARMEGSSMKQHIHFLCL